MIRYMPVRVLASLMMAGVLAAGCVPAANPLNPAGGSGDGGTSPGTGSTGGGGTSGGGSSVGGGGSGANNASELEQLLLERINRARLRPGPEADRHGIAIDEGIPGQLDADPRPAVAFNATLALAARRHADDMLFNDYFAHVNLLGQTPFDRMQIVGYLFSTAGENLAWRGTTGTLDDVESIEAIHVDLFVDSGIPDRGHRVVMLNPAFREVGLAARRGQFTENGQTFNSMMVAQDYGTAVDLDNYFVVGVVYSDANANGQYDFNEGVEQVSVQLGGTLALTNAGGGYGFEVPPGTHLLTFHTGRQQSVNVIDKNVKVDLVNGARVDVNLGLGEF